MPIYEFSCPKHGVFEKFMHVNTKLTCQCPDPACGRKATRIISRVGTPILKEGVGGFYKPTQQ